MAQQLGQVAVGSIVKLNENGSPVNYIVVHQGKPSSIYDDSCDGTWILRQDVAETRVWDSGNSNVLESSDIHSYLNNTWINRYATDIRNAIKQVKIPYRQNGGSGGTDRNGANGLACKIFLLSGREVGFTNNDSSYFPNDGAKLSYFISGNASSARQKRIANLNGNATLWWLRSPNTNSESYVWGCNYSGGYDDWNANFSSGVRPALVLPSTLLVSDDGSIMTNTAPTLTVPQMVMQGQQATISWSAISGGGWATSESIPVVSTSALVISGTDGDLGTLVNDVQFSISSDQAGVTISATVEVNGGEYDAFTATSGQTYKVNVLDLPTGTGSIVITASATVSDSPITVTRTWTYSKTAQTFPNSGSVATLTKEGNVVYPETLIEAVRASMTPWGGNLSTALNLLKNAALFNRTSQPKYSEVTVSLSGKTEGQTIQLPENGRMVEFYVAKLDYESALNGAGRVLLVREECYDNRAWDAGSVNAWADSDLLEWENGDYKALFPSEIQTAMGTTTYYYTPGNGNNTVTTRADSVFQLSLTELGLSDTNANTEGAALEISGVLAIADYNGERAYQWTRSPVITNNGGAWSLATDGNKYSGSTSGTLPCSRPCFTLPSTFTYGPVYVDQGGTIHESQEYTEAGDWLDVWGNAIPAVKLETGSYTGTGTSGSSNPNTLTFPFTPKIVFIAMQDGSQGISGRIFQSFPWIYGTNQGVASYGEDQIEIGINNLSWDGTTLKWYSSAGSLVGADYQLNKNGVTYLYVAIG